MTSAERLDQTFAALADPTRRAILARLASGDASVGELARPFAMSQPAVSKHLKVLEQAGLVSRGVDAQRRPRRLDAAPLAEACAWLEGYRRHWEARFDRLDAVLEHLISRTPKRARRAKPEAARRRARDGRRPVPSAPRARGGRRPGPR
jgi:DNA-binding transcriptional ArsR family regulator